MASVKTQPVDTIHRNSAAMRGLNPQQRMFIAYLMADKEFSPENAAKQAGYAKGSVHRLLKDPVISREIGRQINLRLKRTEVTADRVLLELAAIAFSDIREIMDEEGNLKNPRSLKGKTARAVQSIKVAWHMEEGAEGPVRVKVAEIKFWNKMEALTLLAKHLGMVTEKHQVNLQGKVEIDYDKLYVRNNAKRVTADVIETLIANPELAEGAPTEEQARYTVAELLDGEDNAETR